MFTRYSNTRYSFTRFSEDNCLSDLINKYTNYESTSNKIIAGFSSRFNDVPLDDRSEWAKADMPDILILCNMKVLFISESIVIEFLKRGNMRSFNYFRLKYGLSIENKLRAYILRGDINKSRESLKRVSCYSKKRGSAASRKINWIQLLVDSVSSGSVPMFKYILKKFRRMARGYSLYYWEYLLVEAITSKDLNPVGSDRSLEMVKAVMFHGLGFKKSHIEKCITIARNIGHYSVLELLSNFNTLLDK
jgi:hypothetical protein